MCPAPICPALMRYRATHNLLLKVNRILLCMFTNVNWAYVHIKGISGKSGPRTYQTHKNKEGRSILTRTLWKPPQLHCEGNDLHQPIVWLPAMCDVVLGTEPHTIELCCFKSSLIILDTSVRVKPGSWIRHRKEHQMSQYKTELEFIKMREKSAQGKNQESPGRQRYMAELVVSYTLDVDTPHHRYHQVLSAYLCSNATLPRATIWMLVIQTMLSTQRAPVPLCVCPSLAFPQDSGEVKGKKKGRPNKKEEREKRKEGGRENGLIRKASLLEEGEKENILGSSEVGLRWAAWCMILQCALPDNTCDLEWLLSGSPRRNRKFKRLETEILLPGWLAQPLIPADLPVRGAPAGFLGASLLDQWVQQRYMDSSRSRDSLSRENRLPRKDVSQSSEACGSTIAQNIGTWWAICPARASWGILVARVHDLIVGRPGTFQPSSLPAGLLW